MTDKKSALTVFPSVLSGSRVADRFLGKGDGHNFADAVATTKASVAAGLGVPARLLESRGDFISFDDALKAAKSILAIRGKPLFVTYPSIEVGKAYRYRDVILVNRETLLRHMEPYRHVAEKLGMAMIENIPVVAIEDVMRSRRHPDFDRVSRAIYSENMK